jgi:hypothetical protein
VIAKVEVENKSRKVAGIEVAGKGYLKSFSQS